MIVNIGGIDHEIETMYHPKQPKQYDDAVAEGDSIKAMIWRIPSGFIAPHIIQMKIRGLELKANYEAEIKRANEMDPEMLKVEMELQYGCKIKEPRKRSIFNIFK